MLGAGYPLIVPYVVMLIVLLVRPYGLFGTPEIEGSERCTAAPTSTPATSSESAMLPTCTQKALAAICWSRSSFCCRSRCRSSTRSRSCGYLGDGDWLRPTPAVIFAIAALGLNLLTGVAGQVSLGHAFFMGVGAYTGAVLGGDPAGACGVGTARSGSGCRAPASEPRSSGSSWPRGGARPRALPGDRDRRPRVRRHPPGQHRLGQEARRRPRRSGRDFPTFEFQLWKEEPPWSTSAMMGTGCGSTSAATQKQYLFLAVLLLSSS